jgi:hypothetical protein
VLSKRINLLKIMKKESNTLQVKKDKSYITNSEVIMKKVKKKKQKKINYLLEI